MIAALALTILLAQPQNPLLSKVITNPTGQNGYEEYVAAAMILDRPENRAYEAFTQSVEQGPAWSGKPPARPDNVPDRASTLDVYRIQTKKLQGVVDLIRDGNLKASSYPNQPLTAVTLFPELSYFKTSARVIQRAAYVAFAAGDSATATRLILDGLTFSRKMQVGGVIHLRVGQTCEQMMLKAIDRNLDNLSLKDVRAIQAWLQTNGDLALAATAAAERERLSCRADFDAFFAKPNEYFEGMSGDLQRMKELEAAVRQVPAKKRDEIYSSFFKRTEAPWVALKDRLKSPEREWLAPLGSSGFIDDAPLASMDGVDPKAGAGLILYLKVLSALGYGEGDENMSIHLARYNIQERVLGLYMSVIESRWVTGKLPAKLGEMFGKEPIDPATEQPYTYEQKSDRTFRIFCHVKQLGDVGLVYKASEAEEKEPPPP